MPNIKPAADLVVLAAVPLQVQLLLDPGWKMNEPAPSKLSLLEGDRTVRKFTAKELTTRKVVLPGLTARKLYRLQGTLYYCKDGPNGLCAFQSHDQKLLPAPTGASIIEIQLKSP